MVPLARRLWQALRFALVSGAIFLLTGEVLTRAFNLVDRLNGFSRRLYVVTDDPELTYVHRPGMETRVGGVPVRLNALGLRGPEASRAPAPGVHRVLVLGDSATFGEGLPIEETFPALVERELAARAPGRYEVLNGGVRGYNTAAELAFLRRHGLQLAPRTVIVGFNLNDVDPTPVMGSLGILTLDPAARVATRSLANRSEFYLLLRWLVLAGARAWGGGEPAPGFVVGPGERFSRFDRYLAGLRKRHYTQPGDDRWPTVVHALRGFDETARAHGLRLLVAILPDGDQMGVPDPDLRPQAKLLALCGELHLECLDLYPRFAAAAGELHLDTMHPNAAGNRVIARTLADHLLAPPRATAPAPAPPAAP